MAVLVVRFPPLRVAVAGDVQALGFLRGEAHDVVRHLARSPNVGDLLYRVVQGVKVGVARPTGQFELPVVDLFAGRLARAGT